MADPSIYRPPSGTIPESPGVYRFHDAHERVIYVGKAKRLRQRLGSYFADLWTLPPRTQKMVTTAVRVDWVTVATEVEALQLEYTWIKEYEPRFNIRYRDDKSYPYLAVTLGEEYPRVYVTRGVKRHGVRYFGPYSHVWAIRETLDLLLRVFQARSCKDGVFRRAAHGGRPCLLGDIGKCSAPCVGRVSAEEHRRIVLGLCELMTGRADAMVRGWEKDMLSASENLEFERAARIRDNIAAVRTVMEKQAVVFTDGTDADVVAFADDDLEFAVQVFHIRDGRIRGQRGWVVEKTVDVGVGDLVHHFVTQVYGSESGENNIPRELLVPEIPDDVEVLTDWLSRRRGSRVTIRVPHRGDKKSLAEIVARNAQQELLRHKASRAGDLTTRGQALEEIATAVGMRSAPLRIECYDVSHIQGTDMVASMVVFEDGLPRTREYRRFSLTGPADDCAAMEQTLRRRFARYDPSRLCHGDVSTGDDTTKGRARAFAYPPQLIVVDGGLAQANVAERVLSDLSITGITVCGLAKRLEELWLPGDEYPVILPRASQGLYMLQRIRDEAHRFAVTYHRKRRSHRMTASVLDGISGLGEVRRKALLNHFGTLTRLKKATLDEISEVPGIGRRTAEVILAALTESQDDST